MQCQAVVAGMVGCMLDHYNMASRVLYLAPIAARSTSGGQGFGACMPVHFRGMIWPACETTVRLIKHASCFQSAGLKDTIQSRCSNSTARHLQT